MRTEPFILALAMGSLACSSAEPAANEPTGQTRAAGKIAGCSGRIAYETWNQAGAKATLLFVNGRSDYTDRYHHLIELIDRPWNIIMYDHYGQGRSDGVRAHAEDFDAQHVCDMERVIEELAVPGLPLVVAAHSMGSFVSTRFAELHPGVAKAYVLGSPMYGIPTGSLSPEQVKEFARTNIDAGAAEVPYIAASEEKDSCEENLTTHDCDYYDRWLEDPYVWLGPPTWGWLYAAHVGFERLFADAAKVEEPALILQAEDDNWVLNDRQDALSGELGSCKLTVFEGDYHELWNELDRAEVVRTALSFLDEALR